MGNMYRSYKEVTHTQQVKVDVALKVEETQTGSIKRSHKPNR